MGTALTKEIERAWLTRMNQNLDECRLLAAALKKSLGIPFGPLNAEGLRHLLNTDDFGSVIEVLLLCAANARADGQWNTMLDLIALCENLLNQRSEPCPYSLYFQKGIIAQVQGDHSSALEFFLAAKMGAKTSWQEASALANLLFCLENLGLPLEKTHSDVTAVLKKTEVKALVPGVVSQIQAFEMRHAFRNGKTGSLFRAETKDSSGVDQNFYYQLWVNELPFHKHYQSLGSWGKENFSLGHPWFHQKSYRLRTLQGILHPDDLQEFKETEFSDRFYLWTWRWLVSPENFPIERVLALISGVKFETLAHRLTSEDFQLLRNALLWLSLFDPASFQPISRMVNAIKPPQTRDYPLFAFERELIFYLTALRDKRETEAQDMYQNLVWHPLWQSDDLGFSSLIQGLNPIPMSRPSNPFTPLVELGKQLKRFLFKDLSQENRKLTIDLAHSRLLSENHSESQVSVPLCSAFLLLHSKESVDSEEFLRICFGIPKFDSEIHNAKIFNLLARMRKVAPVGLDFRMKSGRIYAEGSWGEVCFQRTHSLAGALQDCVDWKSLVRRPYQPQEEATNSERFVRPVQVLNKLKSKSALSREELEKLTGKSKSTASRLIQRWLKQGILKKTGKAKNTRYLILDRGVLS